MSGQTCSPGGEFRVIIHEDCVAVKVYDASAFFLAEIQRLHADIKAFADLAEWSAGETINLVQVLSTDADGLPFGTPPHAIWDPEELHIQFGIPAGEPGDPVPAVNDYMALVTAEATGVAWDQPATAAWDSALKKLTFEIPAGQDGADGDPAAAIDGYMGDVTAEAIEVAPGTPATATWDPVLKKLTFEIPAGADGINGTDGTDGADASNPMFADVELLAAGTHTLSLDTFVRVVALGGTVTLQLPALPGERAAHVSLLVYTNGYALEIESAEGFNWLHGEAPDLDVGDDPGGVDHWGRIVVLLKGTPGFGWIGDGALIDGGPAGEGEGSGGGDALFT